MRINPIAHKKTTLSRPKAFNDLNKHPDQNSSGPGVPTYLGPILPLPDVEKKLDFSPSLVEIKRPIRKIVGTATNKRLAMKPKLVVSMTSDG